MLFGLTSFGYDLEQSVGLSWLFKVRGPIDAPDNVAVIAIDRRTGLYLDLPELPRDWPRSTHALLIKQLRKLGAAVIVFDIDFRKSRNVEEDKILAESIADAQRVVLFTRLDRKKIPLNLLHREVGGVVITPNSKGETGLPDTNSRSSVWIENILPPTEPIAEAASGLAPFPLPKLQETVYRFWTFKSTANDAATLPSAAFTLYSRNVYDKFYELLKRSGMRELESIPTQLDSRVRASELSAITRAIRVALKGNPNLSALAQSELGASTLADVSPSQREILQSLLDLYSGDDVRHINFYGPPGTVPTIPYDKVISSTDPLSDVSLNILENKVVFVGFSDLYSPDQPDRFHTVFTNSDGIDLSGVEIAATAFGNILQRNAISTLSTLNLIILLFAFGLTMGIGLYYFPVLISVPLAVLLSASYVALAQYLFNTYSYWTPIAIPVLIQLPLALFVGLLGQYFFERRQERKLAEAISYYLPQDVVDKLVDGEVASESIDKTVFATCFATDMKGFSTLGESMEPDQLAAYMNDYFDTLAAQLSRQSVDVTEFRADAIMCAWIASETDVATKRKAVVAALDSCAAIDRFGGENPSGERRARIGLDAGWIFVGHAGGGGHFVYTIVGDCANTAARLESLNNHLGTQVLASRTVVEDVDEILFRPLGNFRVVGRTEPIEIVEIVAEEHAATAQQLDLCTHFAEALSYFHAQEWLDAEKKFEQLTQAPFQDGPASFYLNRCRDYLQMSTLPRHPTIIVMDKK